VHPAARPPPGTGTAPHRPPGRPAQPGRPAVGLPVPHPLPAVRHADRHPAAALHRRGAGRGQPGAGPRRRLPLRPGENGSVEPGGTMPGKRIPAAAAALVLALSALAGCGGGSKKNESGGDSGTGLGKNGAPATTLDINEAARDKVADGGTLRWPLDQIPPNLNYNEIDGTLRDTADVVSATMPELFFYDAEAVPSINKAYLDSAELTARDPKQVVTYKINPKATWSDGTPLTEADFEAQWKADNGTGKDYRISSANGYENIESVAKGADDREVVVTFGRPYADWKGLFSPLYPAATNNDPKTFNEGWIGQMPATAGPFKFAGVDETAKTLTIVRDDKWWGDRPKLDRIVFRAIPGDGQIDALINGEIDFMDVGPDANKLRRATDASGIRIHRAGGPQFRHITINGSGEILKDQKVRQALGMAINRDQIAKSLLGPLGVEAKPLQNHIFMRN